MDELHGIGMALHVGGWPLAVLGLGIAMIAWLAGFMAGVIYGERSHQQGS